MQITYTANDGTNFENEADCLGWEKFTKLRDESIDTPTDPDDPESWDEEFHFFLESLTGERDDDSWGGLLGLWRDRVHLYRMVELMKKAEVN